MSAGRVLRIDAHQHFWRYDPASYGWIDEPMAALRRDYLPADARSEMARTGIDACVAVQVRQSLEETRWLLALADANPFIAGVVGWVDLQARDVGARLDSFAGHHKLVGVRHIVQSEPDEFMRRPAFRAGLRVLQEFGLAYDILVYSRQLPMAIELVEHLPSQPFVLDHLGKPDIRGGRFDAWQRDIRALAARANVCAKVSGLVTEADWMRWTPDELRPYLDVAFDCFGASRLMIGSDWPVCTVAADYQRTMRVVMEYVAGLPQSAQEAVLGGNAQRFWNLTVAA
jgi:L-fuconolactonase